jgi:hypothetical protein
VQRVNYPKEQMHRIRYTKLSPTQISAKLTAVAAAGPACASPFTDALVGKTLQINTDGGPSLNYVFENKQKLLFSADGRPRMEAAYGTLALNNVVLVSHLIPGTQRGYNIVLDRESDLVTVMEFWFSGYQDNREVQRHLSYGYVEVKGAGRPQGPACHHQQVGGQRLSLHLWGGVFVGSEGGIRRLYERHFGGGGPGPVQTYLLSHTPNLTRFRSHPMSWLLPPAGTA